MIKSINHIGIAVKDLDESIKLYQKIFQFSESELHRESVEDQKVNVASFKVGEVLLELTAASSDESPIAKYIEKRGEGIHHIAFESDDVNSDLKRLEKEEISLIDSEAKLGAHDMLIAFLHPKSTGKVLMELCQNK